jgi:hypothetical protein
MRSVVPLLSLSPSLPLAGSKIAKKLGEISLCFEKRSFYFENQA